MMRPAGKTMLRPVRIIVLGFVALILCGSLLLILPFASKSRQSIPYLDALFTSTSATCVTGLVVYDTYTQFSIFGQLVILLLIQIGGLGFMTVATLALMVARKKIGLAERRILSESVNAFQLGGVVKLVKRIILCTFIFEGAGAVLLAIRFCPQFGFWTGAYYAVFHTVSAFCNAGFDPMGRYAPYASFVPYQTDVYINLTMIALIIAGGLGFVVWDDLFDRRKHPLRYKLHTKIVLAVTAVLIIAGTLAFLFAEYNNTLAGLSGGQKLMVSLFQSVTPRTAGFNTVDTGAMTEGGTALTLLLMIVGASPGSTGGGIKTTTLVVFILATIAYLRNIEDMNVFQRRLEKDTLRKAYGAATIYFALVTVGFLCILFAEFKVLVIEDDKYILNFIVVSLKKEGYTISSAMTADEGMFLFCGSRPDIVLLDLGLPDKDGLEVIKGIRELSPAPILVVSARGQEADKIEALDAGADDYITKPFHMGELLARMRVAKRRFQNLAVSDTDFTCDYLHVDYGRRRVLIDGEEVHLTPMEYKVLLLLISNQGKVLTHSHINREVWGYSETGDTKTIRVLMANLRRKIEKNITNPRFIKTEVGVGYRFME